MKNLEETLAKDNDRESLKVLRDYLGQHLSTGYCNRCQRTGPDIKDISTLTRALLEVFKALNATEAPSGLDRPVGVVSALDALRERSDRRTGHGTQTTGAPTSVAKRYGGRRA